MNPTATSQCVPSKAIALLAMETHVQHGDAWLAHIVQCSQCSELLRQAIEDLQRNPTVEESALAAQIAPPKAPPRRRDLKWPLTVAASVAAVGLYTLYTFQSATNDVPALLAQAYTTTRPFEWRLPDSGYSPVRVQRGGPASESPESKIAKSLTLREGGASWSDPKLGGWIELLNSSDPRIAIDLFNKAVALRPNDADLLNLVGAAHARLGDIEQAQSGTEFLTAVEWCSRALAVNPKLATARYNKALALTRLGRSPEALEEWNLLIQSSAGTDPWREEAIRQRDRTKGTHAH